jgi:hypothetical protein
MRTRALLSVVLPLSGVAFPAAAETCDASGWFCEPDAPEEALDAPEEAPDAPRSPAEAPQDEPAAPSGAASASAGLGDLDEPSGHNAAEPAQPEVLYPIPELDDPGYAAGGELPEPGASPAKDDSPARIKKVKRARPAREAALNLRLSSALIDNDSAHDPHMYGVGVAARLRPTPHFAFELGLDVFAGRDWNGFSRVETVGSIGCLVYLNPHSLVQVYMPVGFDISGASVDVETDEGEHDESYRYFGGHVGAGAELRLMKSTAVNVELLGFMRDRVGADSGKDAEFVDESGRATDSSGGGLLRAGVSFYF